MIKIQVTAYNNLPPPQALAVEFNEMGGSIGRADGNALMLPDPERHISRTHATVLCRGDKYVIRDLGTATPVYVNGKALGNGREAPITNGDEIRIGAYVMRVAGDETVMSAQPPKTVRTPPVKEDPLALFGGQPGTDPFADLLSPAAKPPQTPAAGASSQSRTRSANPSAAGASAKPVSKGVIPDDFDPFAEPSPPQPSSEPLPEDLNLALGPRAAEPSIDQLFGLDSSGQSLDPLGIHHGSDESFQDSGAGTSLDPLVALGVTPRSKPSAAPQRDDMPELHRAFRPPDARPGTAVKSTSSVPKTASPPSQPRPSAAPAAGDPPDPFGIFLSWENTDSAGRAEEINTRIVPSPKTERPPIHGDAGQTGFRPAKSDVAASNREAAQTGAPVAVPAASAPARRDVPAADSASVHDQALREELLRAFLAGAGVENLELRGGLSPEMMSQLGQLLREATQGTLDLLLARALTKREVRADATMIAAQDNNPLKFSPNVEVALAQLLAPQARGFMPPLAAMKDAYDDLRAHQFGFMAGMRAALSGVLERLNPEQLEPRLKQKSMLDSLLPMNRKAKLWDLFSEFYQDIAQEAEEDFHALFGKEFLRAYQAQIAKLAREEKDRGQ